MRYNRYIVTIANLHPTRSTGKAKTLVAALGAVALGAAAVVAPLTVPTQAYAEVVPLAKGEVMNQELMAQATAKVEFTLPSIEVAAIPEAPEADTSPDVSDGTQQSAEADGGDRAPAVAPSAGTPDPGSAKAIAQGYVGAGAEFDCLVALWNKESGWNVHAHNPSSGAYGIPQSLPGSKMASAGADWQTNADTQIRWGLGYIQGRYGSPCGAWAHSQAVGWY